LNLTRSAVPFLLLLFAHTGRAQPLVAAVSNRASFDGALAPGALLTVFGEELAPETETASGLPLPYSLQGASVEIGGIASPLCSVSRTQIVLQAPFELAPGSVPLIVHTLAGSSAAYMIAITASAPGIFSTGHNGKGRGLMFDTDLQPRDSLNPGESVILYASGLGATMPPALTGAPGSDSEPFNRAVSVPDLYIGDVEAQVLFAGLAPEFVGVYRVIAKVPDNPRTDRIFFRLGNIQSNAVSFARSYPGTETVYTASGPAAGTTFNFDGGVAASARNSIQNAVGLASSFYQSAGLGDPGTANIFALANSETIVNIYADWSRVSTSAAAQVLSSTAIGSPGAIFLYAAGSGWTGTTPALQTKIIAHEFFHVLQFKLAPQGIGVPDDQAPLIGPRWLIEGAAEYLGYSTIAANGILSFSAARTQQLDEARKISAPLKTLETLPGIRALGPTGGYSLMFMAVDFMTAKVGLTPLGAFWASIGQGAKWQEAFQSAFGKTIDQFYLDFESYRSVNLRPFSRILGTVTNSSGNPFPGISVYACRVSPPGGPCGYALTDASGHYAVSAADGGNTLSFGRSTDGNKWDGFYNSQGLVNDPSRATIVTVRGADVNGINVRLPF
jgi:uncharacterized protein (TIGR03437 family)